MLVNLQDHWRLQHDISPEAYWQTDVRAFGFLQVLTLINTGYILE